MITAHRNRERKRREALGLKAPVRLPESLSRLQHEAILREERDAHAAATKALRIENDALKTRVAELEAELEQLTDPEAPKVADLMARIAELEGTTKGPGDGEKADPGPKPDAASEKPKASNKGGKAKR